MGNQHISTRIAIFLLTAFYLTFLAACLPGGDSTEVMTPAIAATSIPQRAPAPVEAIDIFQVDTFPVAVSVVARGHFPNECMTIDQIRQERRGGTFIVAIDSLQHGDLACPENRTPFEETIELDLVDLPAGIYVVDVNGLQGTFKLQRDNIPDEGNAVLGGQVWLDLCEVVEDEESGTAVPTAGCVESGDGIYQGNGLREADEPGLGGVRAHLGAGVCPATGLATTITDADGTFLFSGLMAGDYCLSVTGEEGQNSALIAEGRWTFPIEGGGQSTITLLPGDNKLDLGFGWSALQRPEQTLFFPEPDADDCTNKALFIADLTIADDTPLFAGQTFTKTWQLQNLGSCTWDAKYSLVQSAGDEMGAADSVPLTATVPPGEVGNLSVVLIAPEGPGTYRGEWKLLSPEGFLFGIGPGSDRPFWVQIVVVEDDAVG